MTNGVKRVKESWWEARAGHAKGDTMSKIAWLVWCGAICVFCVMVPVRPASAQGWYLLYPPINAGKERAEPDLDAPLSAWQQYGAYDSVADCNKEMRFILSLQTVRDDTESIDAWLLSDMGVDKFVTMKRLGGLEGRREWVRQQAKSAQANPLHMAFLQHLRCVSVADPRLGQPKAAH
jgi:hypothetical protein